MLGCFFDRIHIDTQTATSAKAVLIFFHFIFANAVHRCKKHNLCPGITVDQLLYQNVHRTAESILCPILLCTNRCIAMAKIIGSAKNNNHICIFDHFFNSGGKITILIITVRILLNRDFCAADSIAKALCTCTITQNSPKNTIR